MSTSKSKEDKAPAGLAETGLNSKGVSVYKDSETGAWFFVEINYDFNSNIAKVARKLAVGNSRDEAIERFKIESVKLGLVS